MLNIILAVALGLSVLTPISLVSADGNYLRAPALPYTEKGETYKLTFYSPSGYLTRSEKIPAVGMVASTELPLGTEILIQGHGFFTVEDTGHLGEKHLDVFVDTQEEAIKLGVQYAKVYILGRKQ